ncbi:glycoside hydrolase family 32 protein [Metabacillus arenae]|uniref:Sucrose-6-phosphate hydrolase n=1 Tax=Metabacillus arenae TaxID=2771434 RepID=A0A926NKX8_9BACI|nr:sucrose-6-phosphate hydrolase [Metabacillus arenae]MBD1382945.1 sucrose-6-phosphate hydrolase [Metabacillus arenae]
MEWTRDRRYRRIEEVSSEKMKELTNRVTACPWRQSFHIQPKTGLLNDPNGFAYFQGTYHLFYQWFPLGPVHGLKYWYHVKSKDLVHWEDAGIGIAPGYLYDNYGAYSGSAIEHNDKLFLMYTGNTRDENWVRHPYQCMAVMNREGAISKLEEPVISAVPKRYTDHFRDPKVWKQDDHFYAVIGAQRENMTGTAVIYQSEDLIDWSLEGELKTSLQNFGYMWECPDYFELDNQGIFVFSPQGIEAEGDLYQNIYQSGYIIGEPFNPSDRTFHHGSFQELDRGFDFYAPQTTLGEDGRRILVGWMGLPEIDYPSDVNGWAHCLTLPRELSVRNGKLIQQPVKELKLLRKKEQNAKGVLENEVKMFDGIQGTAFEMVSEISSLQAEEVGIELRANETKKTVITFYPRMKKLTLDRSCSGEEVGSKYGTSRACYMDTAKLKLHLFVDTSSVEIFVNSGEEVFTSRIFPDKDCDQIRFFAKNGRADFKVQKWDIRKA